MSACRKGPAPHEDRDCLLLCPLHPGGGRFIVDWLEEKLRDHGHQVEKFYLPSDERPEILLDTLLAYRMMNAADGADRSSRSAPGPIS